MSRVWPAYYAGRCNNCGAMFEVGTEVMWESGKVVEAVCDPIAANAALAMGPMETKVYRDAMCPKCFTVHALGQEGCQ